MKTNEMKMEIVNRPDLFDSNKKYAICLLTFQPKSDLLKLYSKFQSYTYYSFYVVVDDQEWNTSNLQKEFPKFHFIKIKEEDCKKNGFYDFNFFVKNGEPSAWDKAIMYFSHIYPNDYDFVWFIEDDVFIPNIENIFKIDQKYNDDFIVKKINCNEKQDWNKCCEKKVDKIFHKTICKTMVCICRISKHFFHIINQYIQKYKSGFFIEFFFPILAKYYQLQIKELNEMSTIVYRKNWTIEEILEHPDYFYHPIKDIQQQKELWNVFNIYYYYINIYDLSETISKLRILDFSKSETNLIQQCIYQNVKNKNEKIIVKKINHKNILIFEHNIQNYLFENITQIETFDQGILLALNMKYKFVCFQTLIEEIYINNKNDKISIIIYPGFLPFLKITSSSNKFPIQFKTFDHTCHQTSKNIQDILQQQNKYFNTQLSLDINTEFSKLDKSIKYISKNKDYYLKMIQQQKNMYDHLIKDHNIHKIYKSNSFHNFHQNK